MTCDKQEIQNQEIPEYLLKLDQHQRGEITLSEAERARCQAAFIDATMGWDKTEPQPAKGLWDRLLAFIGR